MYEFEEITTDTLKHTLASVGIITLFANDQAEYTRDDLIFLATQALEADTIEPSDIGMWI